MLPIMTARSVTRYVVVKSARSQIVLYKGGQQTVPIYKHKTTRGRAHYERTALQLFRILGVTRAL